MRHALLAVLLAAGGLSAADSAPDPAAVRAAMERMSTIGAEHAKLAQAAGEWEVHATKWMDPAGQPQQATERSTFAVMLDGRWVSQDYRGEMMGKPYVGHGMYGYDTMTKQYQLVWFDSVSTAMMPMSGTSSDGGKTITYTYEMAHCPMTNGPMTMRHVVVNESADRMVQTMYQMPKGAAEHKVMELVYTRKGAAK
jgi:hypothetical protein